MNDPGVRNPRRNMLICLGVALAAWALVAAGAFMMHRAGGETAASAPMIGIALLPAILAPAMAYNFWRGVKVFAAIRRGENEIGRWRVTARELADYAVIDDARNAHGGEYLNVWTPPRALPPGGLEIIFAADGVLVSDTYFALVNTGMFKFTRVGMLTEGPPIIEFVTVMTAARGGSTMSVRSSVGVLRLPGARLAGAQGARVLDHFQRVAAREIVVNPGFYRLRMRIGLIGAPIFFAIAAVGYLLDGDGLPDLMLIAGILFGGAMTILALAAMWMGQAQRRRP